MGKEPAAHSEQTAREQTESTQDHQGSEDHRPRPQDFSRNGLEGSLACARHENRQGKSEGDEHFEESHEPARLRCPRGHAAQPAAADRRPEEPTRKHETKGHLIAAENHHQFAHQNNLRDHGGKADQHQNGQHYPWSLRDAAQIGLGSSCPIHGSRISLTAEGSQTQRPRFTGGRYIRERDSGSLRCGASQSSPCASATKGLSSCQGGRILIST